MLVNVRGVKALGRLQETEAEGHLPRKAPAALLGVHKVGDGLQEEVAFRNHVRVKGDDIRRGGPLQGAVQVSRLKALVVRAVKVADAHAVRQFLHFRAAVVVAEPDVDLASVRIVEMDTAVDGLPEKLRGLIVGGNENIHLGIVLVLNGRKRVIPHAHHVLIVDEGFQEAHEFHGEKHQIAGDRQKPELEGDGVTHAPAQVDQGEDAAEEQDGAVQDLLQGFPLSGGTGLFLRGKVVVGAVPSPGQLLRREEKQHGDRGDEERGPGHGAEGADRREALGSHRVDHGVDKIGPHAVVPDVGDGNQGGILAPEHGPHPEAGAGEITVPERQEGSGIRTDQGGGLRLVGEAPDGEADSPVVQKGVPLRGRGKIHHAAAVLFRHAAFGDENRQALIQRGLQYAPEIGAVGSGVKMEGVQDVAGGEGVPEGCDGVPVEIRRAGDNYRLRAVGADHGDHFFRVAPDILPGGASVRLVADFVDEVRNAGVLRRNRVEELHRFVPVKVRVVIRKDVPVHDDIEIGRDGGVDSFPDEEKVFVRVPAAVVFRVHGEADDACVPVLREFPEQGFIYEIRVPGDAVGAYAPQRDRVPVPVGESGARHVQLPVDGGAGFLCGRGRFLRKGRPDGAGIGPGFFQCRSGKA